MAGQEGAPPRAPGSRDRDGGLGGFLESFRELAAIYGEKAASLAPDADSRPLVDHYTKVIQQQIGTLSRRMMSTYEDASQELKAEVDQMLDMTAGRMLAEGAKGPMTTMRSLGAFAAAGPIFTLIKKILKLLAEKLGVSIPTAIEILLEIIDELLGEQAGSVWEGAAERAHRSEIKYLKAQYHLTRLVQLRDGGGDRDERNGA
jgi:hypothetical protein